MNEERKSYNDYMNPKMSEQKQDANDLIMQIGVMLTSKKIDPADWIVLDKISTQIRKQNFNLSNKVLRSMQNKFQMIQKKYER